MGRTRGAKNASKGPSTKRLVVAQRYTKRLKALQDKGIDISYFDKLTKSIPGVKRTKKGISIDAAIYEKNKEAIISSLDIAIPSYKKYKELEGIAIKTVKLEKTLNKRAQDVLSTFDFNRKEFMERGTAIEGITLDEEGNFKINASDYSEDLEKAALNAVFSVEELVEDAVNNLRESGLSEGDIALLSDKQILAEASNIYNFKSDGSVFKEYYSYFNSKEDGGGAIDRLSARMNKGAYDDASSKMRKLGSVLRKEGFQSMSYYDAKKEVMSSLGKINAIEKELHKK